MEARLVARWIAGLDAIPIVDEASTSAAREAVRGVGARLGLDRVLVERLAVAASELATNQLAHARRGQVAVRPIERGGIAGIEIVAADAGAGIRLPSRALEGRYSSGGGLGAGLAGTRRLVDELDLDVRLGEGTCVRARAFAAPVPYRSEVGILGRPCVGERESGDDGDFVRTADALLVGVADGLGHGPLATDAAARAVEVLLAGTALDPREILEACGRALVSTRGAVMAVARVDRATAEITQSALGDVSTHLYRAKQVLKLGSIPGFLGETARPLRQLRVTREVHQAGDLLVLFSDGLTSRADVSGEAALLREHPIVVAEQLLLRFGRDHDDALVLVAR